MTKEEAQDILDNDCSLICGCVDDFGDEGLYTLIRKFLEIAAVDVQERHEFSRLTESLKLCKEDWQYFYAIATLCDILGLCEHGTSVRFAWITRKGMRVLEAIKILEGEST